MHQQHVARSGGLILMAGGLASLLAILLHAPQPMTLEAFTAVPSLQWVVSHWLIVVAGLTIGAGGVAATHVMEQAGRPTALLLARAGMLMAGALLVLVGGIEAAIYPMLAQLHAAGGDQAAASAAYAAVNFGMLGAVYGLVPVLWTAVFALAFAMLNDDRWPKLLGLAGMAVAVVNVAGLFLVQDHMLTTVIGALGFGWIAAAGFMLSRLTAAAPAAVHHASL
jgi:hypothetical protein